MERDQLFDRIKKLDYISDIELSNQEIGNFNEIKAAIRDLLIDGLIVCVGSVYNKDYKKIFPIYTSKIKGSSEVARKIKNKQFLSQKKSITELQLKRLKAAGNFIAIKQELEIIKKDAPKLSIKYFQLTHKDIIGCYEWVIAHGAQELEDREQIRLQKIQNEIDAARHYRKVA